MKLKYQIAHMQAAHIYANLSSAQRLKVGAIIVKDDRIISIGYNGMPSEWDNTCEIKEYMEPDAASWLSLDEINKQWPNEEVVDGKVWRYKLKTKPEVLHAEMNALMKLARSTESGLNSSLFITHSPCLDCAKGIYQAGIKEVFYTTDYRSTEGIEFLTKCGIEVKKIDV